MHEDMNVPTLAYHPPEPYILSSKISEFSERQTLLMSKAGPFGETMTSFLRNSDAKFLSGPLIMEIVVEIYRQAAISVLKPFQAVNDSALRFRNTHHHCFIEKHETGFSRCKQTEMFIYIVINWLGQSVPRLRFILTQVRLSDAMLHIMGIFKIDRSIFTQTSYLYSDSGYAGRLSQFSGLFVQNMQIIFL